MAQTGQWLQDHPLSPLPRDLTGFERNAQTDSAFRTRERGASSDEDSESDSLQRHPDPEAGFSLLAPPISMMLAVSSRYQLRPYFGGFWFAGLIAFIPVLTGTGNLAWIAAPIVYLMGTQMHSVWQYRRTHNKEQEATGEQDAGLIQARAGRSWKEIGSRRCVCAASPTGPFGAVAGELPCAGLC